MTVYELIRNYYRHNPDGHFFDRDTLKFFGERISDMRVLKHRPDITDCVGEVHEKAYVLSHRQEDFYGNKHRAYDYFDCETFDMIIT